MNKRLLLSLASLAASSALVVGATFAFFSDSGTSNDNVFSAGTLDLKLSDDTPETDQMALSLKNKYLDYLYAKHSANETALRTNALLL